jgi:hypothetical protein
MIGVLIALRIVLESLGRPVAGPLPQADPIHGVEWISPDAAQGPWPKCFVTASAWSCWGVNARTSGIVILHASASIWWTLLDQKTTGPVRSARWGRLLVISGEGPDPSPLRVTFGRPVAPPPGRFRAIRLGSAPVAGAQAVVMAPNAIWIAGDAIPPKSWIEIASDTTAPVYLSLEEATAAPASLPLHVALRDALVVHGLVVSGGDRPAGGALISVFRLIDPPRVGGTRAPPPRVLAAETTADAQGRFALPSLGDADYEMVAWHPQAGRASQSIRAAESEIVVRLRSSGLATGRALFGGRPVHGANVTSVPDAGAFSAAEDMTELKGGDARTGPDGRFTVMVAPSGGGELRIGGGAYPVKRVALPRPPAPVFDVGDVDLGRPIDIVVILDRDPGCALRAAGPVGRTGLQLVAGRRTASGAFTVAIPEPGYWEFTLTCGGDGRSLSPSLLMIEASHSGREVVLSVR